VFRGLGLVEHLRAEVELDRTEMVPSGKLKTKH
jgi:hypothetical protein